MIETLLLSRHFHSGATKDSPLKLRTPLVSRNEGYVENVFHVLVFHSMREITDISLRPRHNAKLPTIPYAMRLQPPCKTIGQQRVLFSTLDINIHLHCRSYRSEAREIAEKRFSSQRFIYNQIKNYWKKKK